jgi:outer membrane protein OmpA-like peptidoglycan-associated protein
MLNVSKTGYLFFSENFALHGIFHLEEPFLKDVPLSPIRTGQAIVLKNIFFDFDSYELLPQSELELQKVIDFMTNNPTVKIEISGHTDNTGTDVYNQELSENRARVVVGYLKTKGIEQDRMEYRGYGSKQPVADNETDENRALNRRTELKIIEH